MNYTRKNAWNNGGTFDNPDLLWYAKAVGVMKSRPISDPTSWWFYAAIHGQYLIYDRSSGYAPVGYPNWTRIRSIPESVNLSELPSQKQTDTFWSQCQHQTWFFTPWHRGYLVAIEKILRDIIVNELGGPADWALPYWNYLSISDQEQQSYNSEMMPAFTQPTLPDETPNPLYVPERYGPEGDGKIYVPVGMEKNDKGRYIYANDIGQFGKSFTTEEESTTTGYGGEKTGFSHYGSDGTGLLEANPHNRVHNFIGGSVPETQLPSVTVEANLPWQSTGIIIQPSQEIYISYDSKNSKGWTADPSDNEGKLYDIKGSPNIVVSPGQPLYPVVNVPMGALVGRVDGGTPFLITDGSAIPGNLKGLLELCINDDITGAYGAGLTDNTGSITLQLFSVPTEEFEGFMSDPGIAALDPIFYIHHANIDRLWAAWNETGGNENANDPDWLAGPIAHGNSQFAMPMDSAGTPWFYAPKDVNSTTVNYYGDTPYAYTYDNLALTTYRSEPTPAPMVLLQERLTKLGVEDRSIKMATRKNPDLVGTSDSFTLKRGTTATSVQLDNQSWDLVADSFLGATKNLPDEVYLEIEGVRGTNNANFLSVFVNGVFVDSVSLFGIRLASMGGKHGGTGLAFRFDITSIVDDMHLSGDIDVNQLNVEIKTAKSIFGEISIGRISVYRVNQ